MILFSFVENWQGLISTCNGINLTIGLLLCVFVVVPQASRQTDCGSASRQSSGTTMSVCFRIALCTLFGLHCSLIGQCVDITGGASEQRKIRRNAKKVFLKTTRDQRDAGLLGK